MNLVKRMLELEGRVADLEARSASQPNLPGIGEASPDSAPEAPKAKRSHPTRFTPDAKALIMAAWDSLAAERDVEDQPVTISEWREAVIALDTDNDVPNLVAHGESLRALLAERTGLKVMWSSHVRKPRATEQ